MSENEFPQAGARARLVKRFERDFRAWLATPEGRFAAYCAERERLAAKAGPATRAAEGNRARSA